MRIEYFHASNFGNGAKVVEEFNRMMVGKVSAQVCFDSLTSNDPLFDAERA